MQLTVSTNCKQSEAIYLSLTEKDWLQEQSRVEYVTGQIDQRIKRLELEVGDVRAEVVDIRKHFWDDVTVNFSNAEDLTETYFSMKQQADVLSERERTHRHTSATLKKLKRLVRSPYFGRIDFVEDGSGETETIYLGIASFQEDDSFTYLVYDWRAPISSLYYDYPPGPAKFLTPSGEVAGEMMLKRQYMIRDGHIHFMFDTGVTIGDELLQQVLSRGSDTQMKTIVATIQKEQNLIIRNDHSRMLIVQGAAGSGKTSAALQRVAYLLYKHRESLQADQMVLFSPNPLFNSYVSAVLPELGEENMQQTTFHEYVENRLGSRYQVEDPFSQMEFVLTSDASRDYEIRLSGLAYKTSKHFLKVVLNYISSLGQEGMLFQPVRFRDCDIVTAQQVTSKFYAMDSSIRLPNRLVLLRDWLLEQLHTIEDKEWTSAWVEDEVELLEPQDYRRAYNELRKSKKGKRVTFDDYEFEKEFLSKLVVRKHLKSVRNRIKAMEVVDIHGLYRELFANRALFTSLAEPDHIPLQWPDICSQTMEKLDRSELSYEDATPYLLLFELVHGFQANTSVKHVLIDEAQDYSPFQLEFLKRLFPRCKMTALGDINQAIFAHASVMEDFDPLTELFGPDKTELIRLTRSYRSTYEIVEFTKGMIPGGGMIVPFNRNGDKPRILMADSRVKRDDGLIQDIDTLQQEGCESIAIICKTAIESAEAYEALHLRTAVQLITKSSPTFAKGTLIIPAYLAKGVEFDAVLIYDGSTEAYNHERERKLFYTACTRAMHVLNIYAIGDICSFIAEQSEDTYVLDDIK